MTPDEVNRPVDPPDGPGATIDHRTMGNMESQDPPDGPGATIDHRTMGNMESLDPPDGSGATIKAFDEAVERVFEQVRGHPVADRVFYTASELGNFSILWHALAWAGATSARGRRNALRVSTVLAVESALVNGPVKSAFNRSRPLIEHDHPHRLRQPLTSSFPSGHASAAVVAAVLLSESRRRRLPILVAASVVAVSRIHVRIHHASDVVVGTVVGALLAKLFRKIWPLR